MEGAAAAAGISLVCGGGGVWGIAWMAGVIAGLADAGVDVRRAGTLVGTSAGSVVATQLAGGLSTDEMFERQTIPARQAPELSSPPERLVALSELMRRPWRDPDEKLRAVCRMAEAVDGAIAGARLASIAARLSPLGATWPDARLLLTAVDMDTCELQVFGRESGVSLVDAVAASCAVPGVWPPVEIAGRRYVDGGVWRTAENAHFARGSKAVLILSPMGQARPDEAGAGSGLAADVAELEAEGAAVMVLCADEESLRAMAPSPLDPATRGPGAAAGRRQGAREADRVGRLFEAA